MRPSENLSAYGGVRGQGGRPKRLGGVVLSTLRTFFHRQRRHRASLGDRAGYSHRRLVVKPKWVRLGTGRNLMPIQIYLKIAWRRQFSIQPDEVNIPHDFTFFHWQPLFWCYNTCISKTLWRSESKMALIQRDFRKDKPKPLRVRIVCSVKILTILERATKWKKQFHSYWSWHWA